MFAAHAIHSSSNDYAWFENTELGLAVASCLTFVRDVSAAEAVRRLGGAEVARLEGLDRFGRYSDAVTVPPEAYGESFDHGASTGREFAAVCDLPGGAFMLETYGALSSRDDVLGRLSSGTSVAAVFNTEHTDPRFAWAENGIVRVSFDPFHAGWREGSTPDALLPQMQELGFNLIDEDIDPDNPRWVFDGKAAWRALALSYRVTGIRLTEDALTERTYLAVSVPAAGVAAADDNVVPPLHFHDVAPTVDQPQTMDLPDGLTEATIGEPITVRPWAHHGYDAAVRYTVRSVLLAPYADPNPEDAGTVWLLVDVEAVGLGELVQAQPHDFAFVAADRSRYPPSGLSDKQQLEMTSLREGETVSGLVLFQVPTDVPAHGRIVGQTLGDDGDLPLGYWRMDGPRRRTKDRRDTPGEVPALNVAAERCGDQRGIDAHAAYR